MKMSLDLNISLFKLYTKTKATYFIKYMQLRPLKAQALYTDRVFYLLASGSSLTACSQSSGGE
jgi:hypothetical protein